MSKELEKRCNEVNSDLLQMLKQLNKLKKSETKIYEIKKGIA